MDANEGTCQICERICKLKGNLVSLHGYVRPGDGEIRGRCRGAQKLRFEVSSAVLATWLVELRATLDDTRRTLATFDALTSFYVEEHLRDAEGRGVYQRRQPVMTIRSVGPEDPRFEGAKRAFHHKLTMRERALVLQIERQQRRLDAWRPQEQIGVADTTEAAGR